MRVLQLFPDALDIVPMLIPDFKSMCNHSGYTPWFSPNRCINTGPWLDRPSVTFFFFDDTQGTSAAHRWLKSLLRLVGSIRPVRVAWCLRGDEDRDRGSKALTLDKLQKHEKAILVHSMLLNRNPSQFIPSLTPFRSKYGAT